MKLKNGILLHNQLPEGYNAIQINSGTVFHTATVADMVNFQGYSFRPQYEDDAYIAKRDWRSLTRAEIKSLQANETRNYYNTVYLGDLPEPLKEKFRRLELEQAQSHREVFDRFRSNPQTTNDINTHLHAFLSTCCNNRPFHFHCLGTNFPNIEMVACDLKSLPAGYQPPDVKYIGLHNDGTTAMTLYTAHKFSNRISINLGKQNRSFLFVNLSMIQALNMLKQKIDVKAHQVNISNFPKFFFKHFPDYPVIRAQLKPYQYYIAPTDNCFHDGSTLGNTELDITLIYFGYFRC
jgi:hypothetical protein